MRSNIKSGIGIFTLGTMIIVLSNCRTTDSPVTSVDPDDASTPADLTTAKSEDIETPVDPAPVVSVSPEPVYPGLRGLAGMTAKLDDLQVELVFRSRQEAHVSITDPSRQELKERDVVLDIEPTQCLGCYILRGEGNEGDIVIYGKHLPTGITGDRVPFVTMTYADKKDAELKELEFTRVPGDDDEDAKLQDTSAALAYIGGFKGTFVLPQSGVYIAGTPMVFGAYELAVTIESLEEAFITIADRATGKPLEDSVPAHIQSLECDGCYVFIGDGKGGAIRVTVEGLPGMDPASQGASVKLNFRGYRSILIDDVTIGKP